MPRVAIENAVMYHIVKRRCSQHAGKTDGHLFVHIWIRRWRRLLHRLVFNTQEIGRWDGKSDRAFGQSDADRAEVLAAIREYLGVADSEQIGATIHQVRGA